MNKLQVLGSSVRGVVRRVASNNRPENWGVELQILLDTGDEPELVRATHWRGSEPLPHSGEPRFNAARTYEYYDAPADPSTLDLAVPKELIRARRSDGTKVLLDAQTLTPWAIELVPQTSQDQAQRPRFDM